MSLEQGIRAAFLASFSADGIVFEPGPIHLREAWPQRPAPADPKASRLEWQPAQARVAQDTRRFNVADDYEPLLADDAHLHRGGESPLQRRDRHDDGIGTRGRLFVEGA